MINKTIAFEKELKKLILLERQAVIHRHLGNPEDMQKARSRADWQTRIVRFMFKKQHK